MAGDRRRKPAKALTNTDGEEKRLEIGETGDDPLTASDLETARLRLRERWELASVLNFLIVFEPVIGSDLKMSAEEIEMGLIKPDSSLTKLHVTLLKGIPPVSRTLNEPGSWVTVLCKKLAPWWPWVAEGEIPLSAAKREEISRYEELDPTTRLLILKALCEIRADQDDATSYISDAVKSGTQISCFRKDKIGGDGNGTSYWFDGNANIGHRLYREVKKFEPKAKLKGKDHLIVPAFSIKWETLATNLEEFRKVVDELSSSKVVEEVAVGKTIESDAIPVLEKICKKREMVLKRQQRNNMLLNSSRSVYATGITRSCRNRRPVSYTFDEYDRAIDEALQITKIRKTGGEQKHEEKFSESGQSNDKTSNERLDGDTHSGDSSVKKHATMENETNNDKSHGVDGDDDSNDDDYHGKESNEDGNDSELSHSEKENNYLDNENHHPQKKKVCFEHKPVGSRWSKRLLAGNNGHPVEETRNMGTKNRSRQRPTRNTAIESAVIPDSEDEGSENTMSEMSSQEENSSPDAGTEEHSDS